MILPDSLKRIYYRSWHRGCKETDLVLGPFAERHLASLSPEMLALYEALLDENDWDIWQWVSTGGAPAQYEPLIAMMRVPG